MTNTKVNELLRNQWILKLSDNPKYDSNWVKYASDILSREADPVYTEEFLSNFDALQLTVLIEMLDNEEMTIDRIILIFNKCYNADQMKLLYIAETMGILDDRLLDPNVTYVKMKFIIDAAKIGFNDLIEYLDYSNAQIEEIYSGFADGIDYKSYAYKHIPAEDMQLLRHALCIGKDVVYEEDGSMVIK